MWRKRRLEDGWEDGMRMFWYGIAETDSNLGAKCWKRTLKEISELQNAKEVVRQHVAMVTAEMPKVENEEKAYLDGRENMTKNV